MKVFRSLDAIKLDKNSCVTIGVFDGIHIGHQRLLRKVVDIAHSRDLLSVAFTFDRHPESVIPGKAAPLLLTTTEEKLAFFQNFGIKAAVVAPFDNNLAQTSARDFVKRILLAKLKAKFLVVGLESTFGKDAHGNAALLTSLGEEMDFQVEVMEQITLGDNVVSSTAIREAIDGGDMEGAMKMLGRPYELSGPVVTGDGRGKELGFPTVNLSLPEGKVIPPDGVYAGLVQSIGETTERAGLGQKREAAWDHLSVIYVGKRPTFGGKERIIEAHICEEGFELSDKELRLAFIYRLREDRTFATKEELVVQMIEDAKQAFEMIANYYAAK
jgi:riboflavin kinase/FMN adenylyltransferase